ncbi:PPOX class F420-dependent oxidoreductase [Kitasatospora purpeofusca]|uniref:PPOX class F420-dependent oxidoreductase n=1 Tax=Kitasatospora purpeofusca TaxID=67352 RepID=UPI000B0A7DD9|nr:PPOX class F420-dependent oxidoreductase [Kitasatospora purpeofusca]MCX4686288.1 PPOX class F420-dependent oxidoreductase [Kitasatospora purpeofusca]MCX4753570.1 PPOX class F420-dependent oxidoreductase [Kitasatospora purpeofusca]WSR33062.1 PPOX class F420-dependent oxidoreductase [Kitasatospora purpeofusca]WSR41137.1 PPOX class F420-dependent oxidoreductase [Kitasatospora purpeofusca]
MAANLSDQAKALIDDKSFAVITTIQPDGSPQSSVVWVKRDGEDILFSTVEGRRKHLNLVKDARVSLLVNPPENPYTYLEVRGEVSLTREGGRELIDELSLKYRGEGTYGFDGPEDVRVVVRLTPRKVVGSI